MNVIDLHCHILPGLDDGPGSMVEALAMARIAAADGIVKIVATPHATPGLNHDFSNAMALERVQHFQARLDDAQIALKVLPGAEILLMPDTTRKILKGHLATINQSRYVLVEFPLTHLPPDFQKELFSLRAAGLVPIIAHPERYPYVQAAPKLLESMVCMGCLVQVNAMSITGDFGYEAMKCAHDLVVRRMAHLVASDGHNQFGRPPRICGARPWIEDLLCDREESKQIFLHRPNAILEDRGIDTIYQCRSSASDSFNAVMA